MSTRETSTEIGDTLFCKSEGSNSNKIDFNSDEILNNANLMVVKTTKWFPLILKEPTEQGRERERPSESIAFLLKISISDFQLLPFQSLSQ